MTQVVPSPTPSPTATDDTGNGIGHGTSIYDMYKRCRAALPSLPPLKQLPLYNTYHAPEQLCHRTQSRRHPQHGTRTCEWFSYFAAGCWFELDFALLKQ
jgi:hypothetical protein